MKTKPNIFVGSSTDSLDLTYAVQNNLAHDAKVIPWTQGVFQLTQSTLDSLIRGVDVCQYGIFIFSPSDIAEIKGEQMQIVRDNVLIEFGMFLGRHGKDRTFFIMPKNNKEFFRLPTDLLGITPATYDDFDAKNPPSEFDSLLGPACNKIRTAIRANPPITGYAEQDSEFINLLKEEINGVTIQCKNEVLNRLNGLFRQFPSTLISSLTQSIDGSIVANGVETLVSHGNLEEAVSMAKEHYEKNSDNESAVETYIGVLLKLNKKEKTELAWQILQDSNLKKTQVYTNISLCFWEDREYKQAIEVGFKVLELAETENDAEEISKIKGNISYYMAETDNQNYEIKAREFAREAYNADPNRASRIDTMGYVLITFGDEDEISKGMELCLKSYTADVKVGCSNVGLYEEHIRKATTRLETLNSEDPLAGRSNPET